MALVAHHEQAAGVEVEIEHAARPEGAAYRHAPRRPEAHQSNRRALGSAFDVIAMRRDAVVSVSVEVQTSGRKCHAADPLDVRAHRPNGLWKHRILEREARDEPGYVDDAIVHRAALRTPLDAGAELVKPRTHLRVTEKRRPVHDAARFVV